MKGYGKLLSPLGGLPLISHSLKKAIDTGAEQILVVLPSDEQGRGQLMDVLNPFFLEHPHLSWVVQPAGKYGTAVGVGAAQAALKASLHKILILNADVPGIEHHTLQRLVEALEQTHGVIVSFSPENPTGYGRLLLRNEQVLAIVEEEDLSPEQAQLNLCNGGVVGFQKHLLFPALQKVPVRKGGEQYLTDVVALLHKDGNTVSSITTTATELVGVNTLRQLADAEALFQQKKRTLALENGAILQVPDSVIFSHDTLLEEGAYVFPYVVFGPKVVVQRGAVIKSFSHLEGAVVEEGAVVGPFARVRPDSRIKKQGRIGNFVEVKNTVLGANTKVSHLSYLGDATIEGNVNVGAGVITCNYDGRHKHQTHIGAGAFIGASSTLLAPLRIGRGALTAAGSVLTKNVPENALAVGRTEQKTLKGAAKKYLKPSKKP